MPVQTRRKNYGEQQEQHQEGGPGEREDRVSEGALLYPVFCTANIPPKMLDEFIDKAYNGCLPIGENGEVGGAPCILETTDLDSITHGPRKPMPEFKSPFLGKTDKEIRAWMEDNVKPRPDFAGLTFTILDEDTVKTGITRIGSCSSAAPDDRILLADFYTELYVRVPVEMATESWWEQDYLGTDKVFDWKEIAKDFPDWQKKE